MSVAVEIALINEAAKETIAREFCTKLVAEVDCRCEVLGIGTEAATRLIGEVVRDIARGA